MIESVGLFLLAGISMVTVDAVPYEVGLQASQSNESPRTLFGLGLRYPVNKMVGLINKGSQSNTINTSYDKYNSAKRPRGLVGDLFAGLLNTKATYIEEWRKARSLGNSDDGLYDLGGSLVIQFADLVFEILNYILDTDNNADNQFAKQIEPARPAKRKEC